jgi:hypothetical protein
MVYVDMHTTLPFRLFYSHLIYFVAIGYILLFLDKFFPFWYLVPRKIWQPWFSPVSMKDNDYDGHCRVHGQDYLANS